jgi:hypothetical protein
MWSHGGRRPRDGSTDERTGGENNKSAILERQSLVRQRLSRPQRPQWPAPKSPSSCSIASHQSARSRRPPTTASPPTGGCSQAPTPGWPRTATLGHVFVAGDQGPHGDSDFVAGAGGSTGVRGGVVEAWEGGILSIDY